MPTALSRRNQLVLAALLHDIGKFFQKTPISIEGLSGPEGESSHQVLGARWMGKMSEGTGRKDLKNVKYLIGAHHPSRDPLHYTEDIERNNLEKELQALIIGDRLSACERMNEDEEKKSGGKQTGLFPVYFKSVMGEADLESFPKFVLSSYTTVSTPSLGKGKVGKDMGSERLRNVMEIIEGLIKRINNDNFNFTIVSLLSLLKDITFFIPSDMNEKIPIQSLYAHLLSSASLSDALYYNLRANDDGRNRVVYLGLIKIGGLQAFINKFEKKNYSGERAAKILRGRSLFVRILTRLLQLSLMERLNLKPTAFVSFASGKFTFLLPVNEEVRLKEFVNEVNRELWERGYYPLVVSYAIVPLEIEKMEEDCKGGKKDKRYLGGKIGELFKNAKKNSFSIKVENFSSYMTLFDDKKIKKCSRCGDVFIGKDEGDVCEACKRMEIIGKAVKDGKGEYVVVYSKNDRNNQGMDLLGWRIWVKSKNEKEREKWEELEGYVEFFISPSFPENNYYKIGKNEGEDNKLPYWMEVIKKYPNIGCFVSLSPTLNYPNIDDLAEKKEEGRNSQEKSRPIAYVKVDLDNLSVLVENTSDNLTSMITLFDTLEKVMVDIFMRSVNGEGSNRRELADIYLIYLGGDDLSFVARYDEGLFLLRDFYHYFSKYFKRVVTYSASYILSHRKMPIKELSRMAERGLKEAKYHAEHTEKVKNKEKGKDRTYLSYLPEYPQPFPLKGAKLIKNSEFKKLFTFLSVLETGKEWEKILTKNLLYNIANVYLSPLPHSKRVKLIYNPYLLLQFSEVKKDYIISKVSKEKVEKLRSLFSSLPTHMVFPSVITTLLLMKKDVGGDKNA